MKIVLPMSRISMIPAETLNELKRAGLPIEEIILAVCNYFNYIRPVHGKAYTEALIRSYSQIQGVFKKIESFVGQETIFGDHKWVSHLWLSYLATFKAILLEFWNIMHFDMIIKGYSKSLDNSSITLDCVVMEPSC